MTVTLSDETIEKIALRVVQLQERRVGDELISTIEAARILHISTDRMRKLKHRFPHVKFGDNDQCRLMFYKSGFANYIKQ